MMKRRVLFVNDVLSIGGVELSLIDVLNHLDYSQVEVDLFILHPKYDLLHRVNPQVHLLQVKEWRCKLSLAYLWFYLWLQVFQLLSYRDKEALVTKRIRRHYQRRRRKLYFSKDYDIVIAYKHSEAAEFVTTQLEARKRIVFYHQGEIQDYDLHKQAFQAANSIVTVSPGVAKLLSEAYPDCRDKMLVIENLIDAATILQRAKEYKVADTTGKKIIVSCGRLNPEKGFDLAITAARFLLEAGYDYHWYFVGDGTKRQQLESLILDNGLEERITITGILLNPLPYIAACDVYVQPSYIEAFGLSISEAKVLNKPIVSTATLGASQLIQDGVTGILTDFQGESLACSIRQLFDDEQRRKELQEKLAILDYGNTVLEFHRSWQRLLELETEEGRRE